MRHSLLAIALSSAVAVAVPACSLSSCFVAGTRVLTPRGLVAIETLAVGDEVVAWDVEAGASVVRRVAALLRARATQTFRVQAEEIEIAGVTAEHPFWDAERRAWIPARELAAGMRVLAFLGAGGAKELSIRSVTAGEPREVDVFNLSVGGEEQCYFAEGILVHNKSPPYEPDSDQDGYESGPQDCNDGDPNIHVDAEEICDDGIDNDCDDKIDLDDADCVPV
jgi:hypothetical protein